MKGQLEAKGLYGWVMSVKEMPVISFLLGDKSSKKAAIKQELVVPSQELNWQVVTLKHHAETKEKLSTTTAT